MAQNIESFGKYILLEKLATGGMAEVYLAKSQGAEQVSKFFAIKRILPQFSNNSEFIDMFKEEAKIAISLNHKNIVQIMEFGEVNGQFFLVMELIEGRNLRQVLTRLQNATQKLTTEHIVFILNEVSQGLDHAHRSIDPSTGKPLNIIHRDISPQNVMVDFDGGVKICDFGIAKAESKIDSTQAGTLKGKFGYMSPEQAEGLELDFRTDIFSLGIVLWELLAQDRLFLANNEINTLRKIRECQIPSLKKIDPNIHTELERITNKALAKDRNQRYQTAAEFHRDLNRFLNRQYSDFSSHDFSQFAKELYAKEREENRKRMIEYSKIQFAPEATADKTIVKPGAQQQSQIQQQNFPPGLFSQDGLPHDLVQNLNIEEKLRNLDVSVNVKPGEITASALKTPDRKKKSALSMQTQPNQNANAARRPSYQFPDTNTKIRKYQDNSSSSGLITLIFIFACVGVSFLYFQGNEARFDKVRPYLGPFASNVQKILNIESRPIASTSTPGSTSPAQTLPSGERIFIQTEPPGAEIVISGDSNFYVTPTTVTATLNKPMVMSFKKQGYLPISVQHTFVKKGEELKIQLLKTDYGKLNLDVRPAGEVDIYINGRLIPEKPPLRNYPVPVPEVHVRVVSKFFTGNEGEKKIEIRKDAVVEETIFLTRKADTSAK